MARKYFGTDGIRGRVGEGAITPEFVLRLGWAAGQVLVEHSAKTGGSRLILIGKDTRISGYMFESALQAGLISAGIDVGLLGPMPTPAIAYLTRTFQAQAGIVISASHNPYYDNGIKFFSATGTKLDDELEQAIEAKLDEAMQTAPGLGKARRITDAAGRYIEYCKGTVPWGFTLTGLQIVLDCANGATYHVAPKVFAELGARVIPMAVEPDGLNINSDCGSTHPERLQAAVLAQGADLGIALDGDGDRLLMVDHKGELVDGDELLYIIAAHRHRQKTACAGVVGTQMTNLGLEVALKELGMELVRAKVGDRYVIEAMHKHQWLLGGESSGHIICNDVSTTGDGIIAALQVVMAMMESGNNLNQLKLGMSKYPQTMINVRTPAKDKLAEHTEVHQAVADGEAKLNGKGRVLLRPSGTEPLVRVMVEGENQPLVREVAQDIADVVERCLQ
ncbi:phosphoglucosamine mutase [Halioxenophilus aromaticivorans]|uniref:Phosphoglucosamine mutase n=1 Tax=Halioxenophilus aromaticivorans TaxID=1306992 RepID=A0AAV3U9C6_9ALTE